MKIHTSIVDYRKAVKVIPTLAALLSQELDGNLQITILDNSESNANFDTLAGACRNVANLTLIRSRRNTGYTRATNNSVDSSADYIVLLNPDVVLEDPRTLKKAIRILQENVRVGIVGIKQINPDGSTESVARRFPDLKAQLARRLGPLAKTLFKRQISSYEYGDLSSEHDGHVEVDWVQSSFWVVRGDLWRELNGLDERFFLFMAEADFSWRANRAGYTTAIMLDTHARADGLRASGGGLLAVFRSRALRSHIKDAVKYYVKNRAADSKGH